MTCCSVGCLQVVQQPLQQLMGSVMTQIPRQSSSLVAGSAPTSLQLRFPAVSGTAAMVISNCNMISALHHLPLSAKAQPPNCCLSCFGHGLVVDKGSLPQAGLHVAFAIEYIAVMSQGILEAVVHAEGGVLSMFTIGWHAFASMHLPGMQDQRVLTH